MLRCIHHPSHPSISYLYDEMVGMVPYGIICPSEISRRIWTLVCTMVRIGGLREVLTGWLIMDGTLDIGWQCRTDATAMCENLE